MFVLVININSTKLILFSLERELLYIFFVQQHLGVILPVTGGQDTLSVGIYRAGIHYHFLETQNILWHPLRPNEIHMNRI